MKMFSKRQRHNDYKTALLRLDYYGYICPCLPNPPQWYNEFMMFTPENWESHKSLGSRVYTRNTHYHSHKKLGKKFRELILMFCIEMTKPNGKKR